MKTGTIIGGHYQVLGRLGKGGMGLVLRVRHRFLAKEFALKLLAAEHDDPVNWLRFQAEARTLAALSHPALVRVYDLGVDRSQLPFYAMDLVEGETLEKLIGCRGAFSVCDTLDIFLKVLDGLAYAHRHGVVHRDLKPANIMIGRADSCRPAASIKAGRTVKILDFGLSKYLHSHDYRKQNITGKGDFLGSPAYMSPEQCAGGAVDVRADIYSVGCAMFETLTGVLPLAGKSAIETAELQRHQMPPRLVEAAPDKVFPHSLELVVARCLAKNPDHRYQCVDDLIADLKLVQEGREVHVDCRWLAGSDESVSLSEPASEKRMGKTWALKAYCYEEIACLMGLFAHL